MKAPNPDPVKSTTRKQTLLYPNAPWYFGAAVVITWLGFSRSYFSRLLQTDLYHHLHGASAGLWMGLLILQPILYQRGQLAWHRKLGWIGTIVLVPALLIGGVKMMQLMLKAADEYPPGAVYQLSFIDAASLLLFTLFLGLSLWHGRRLALHARYMVCTVLIILPPAITRLLFFIPWFDSFAKTLNGSFVAIEAICVLLLLDDRLMGKLQPAYPLAFGLFLLLHLTMNMAGQWLWWHSLMDRFAGI
ncbi:hypothetical protein [Spirosoma sp. KNUC1025]|uniref:hypothetical protein n=1 Tax=Spirosoma sp. KNUC1025 TaxID=2894082 RepID=UPI00386A630C|nr:hypothetical protein LN737_31375 [Spirosoma sp. KNUC1025]